MPGSFIIKAKIERIVSVWRMSDLRQPPIKSKPSELRHGMSAIFGQEAGSIGWPERIREERVFDVGEYELLVLLFMAQAEHDAPRHFAIVRVRKESLHFSIDVSAEGHNFIE